MLTCPRQEESHSVWKPMRTALWKRKRAQRCDSDGAGSNVAALTVGTLSSQDGNINESGC